MGIFSKKTVPPPDPIKEDFTSPKKFVLLTDVDSKSIEECINNHFKHGYKVGFESIESHIRRIRIGTLYRTKEIFCFTAEIIFIKTGEPAQNIINQKQI